MTRPPLEVADIVRAQGNRFIENHSRWIYWTHRKVLQAIAACRTAILGGHRDQCRFHQLLPRNATFLRCIGFHKTAIDRQMLALH